MNTKIILIILASTVKPPISYITPNAFPSLIIACKKPKIVQIAPVNHLVPF